MLKKRIIPCLDVKNGRTVKGINFVDLRDAGDPVELGKAYSDQGADELVFLDITATHEERGTAAKLAGKVANELSIPFSIGGGVTSVEDFKEILLSGADKVAMNSAAVRNPKLISECAEKFGSQAVVIAIDAKQISPLDKGGLGDLKNLEKQHLSQSSFVRGEEKRWEVFVSGGRKATGIDAVDWAKKVQELGAGEILLTSMDRDGTKIGFDIDLTNAVCDVVSIPVIASGGVGKKEHFLEVFQKTSATGALAASVFHFGEIGIQELKEYLRENAVEVRM